MRRYLFGLGLVALALAGCTDGKPTAEGPRPEAGGSAGQTPAGTLEPLVMGQKPAKVTSVRDVLAMKDGEKVVVSGRTPPENCKPFNAALAAVLLMAPEDLDTPDIKEELMCEDAATCPACKQVFDAHAIRVELVDASGAVVPASMEGFRGLKPGSTLTFEGEVRRDGKDKKLVRLVAKRFYPG
jgi:hypothetical protein